MMYGIVTSHSFLWSILYKLYGLISLCPWFSGKPLYQSGGSCENAEEDSSDWPWGQVSRLLHGNWKLSLLCEVVIYSDDNESESDPISLFFSPAQWLSVLDIIAKALFDNNMEFSQINGIHKFQVSIFIVTICKWTKLISLDHTATTGQVYHIGTIYLSKIYSHDIFTYLLSSLTLLYNSSSSRCYNWNTILVTLFLVYNDEGSSVSI